MKTETEIQNAIDNIRYYSERIRKLSKEQLDIDMNQQAVDTDLCHIRFNALGAMNSGTGWLDIYCDQLESNLKHAVEQDKRFVIEVKSD